MDSKDITHQEAEYAAYVDKGTQVILQEAIQKIVETFSHTDALEDILGYLEGMRETLRNQDDRLKEVQQKDKQVNDKLAAMETSVRTLLQRVQSLEIQTAKATQQVEQVSSSMARLIAFFEKSAMKRLFSRLEQEKQEQEAAE